jgi:hypothetical protein
MKGYLTMAIAFRLKVATLCAAVGTAFVGFSLLSAFRPVAGSDVAAPVAETTVQGGAGWECRNAQTLPAG